LGREGKGLGREGQCGGKALEREWAREVGVRR
jgi:hypothetical protein